MTLKDSQFSDDFDADSSIFEELSKDAHSLEAIDELSKAHVVDRAPRMSPRKAQAGPGYAQPTTQSTIRRVGLARRPFSQEQNRSVSDPRPSLAANGPKTSLGQRSSTTGTKLDFNRPMIMLPPPPSLSSNFSEVIDVDAMDLDDSPKRSAAAVPATNGRPKLIEDDDDDDEFHDEFGLEELPEESLKAIEELAKTQKQSSNSDQLYRTNAVASSSKAATTPWARQMSNGKLPFRPLPQNASAATGPSSRSVSAPGPSSTLPYNVSDHTFQRAPPKSLQTHLPFRANRSATSSSLAYPMTNTNNKRDRKVWDRTSYARTSRLTLGGGGKKKKDAKAAAGEKGEGKAIATKGKGKTGGKGKSRNPYIDDMAGGEGGDDDEEEDDDEDDEEEEEVEDDDEDEDLGEGPSRATTSKGKGKAPAKKNKKKTVRRDAWGLRESDGDDDDDEMGEEEDEGVWDAEGIDFDQFPMPLISGE